MWEDLADDRLMLSHGIGMAGGMLLAQRIGRTVIRREGKALGFEGDALTDFVTIIRAIDRFDRNDDFARQAKAIAEAQKKLEQKNKRGR